ncbi:threonine/serine ThrE exporter family protein [Listeria grayi]|uniref:threonine/serine ThrE exporter family protein n=1 Tax=Listeria grayi TaxID=1641 RepID=UPI001623D327|nr:threonine/serine exporter family protein [Listeria grayi]MBC1921395.1 threonine/serine exporter family protein [Listeria grayi]
MEEVVNTNKMIAAVSLLAGKLLVENGAEISRTEDTMERIIRIALNDPAKSSKYTYVTLNGIFVKLEDFGTDFLRIDNRDYDLNKITQVNQLSRDFALQRITLIELYQALKKVEAEKASIQLWKKYICTAGLSGSIVLIFGGSFVDLPASMIAGVVSFAIYLLISKLLNIPFLAEFCGTFVGGMTGYLLLHFIGTHTSLIMIGAVVPLVPGITITNAIRDIMARHYLSGMIRTVEGLAIAASLGAGIAVVYYLFII